MKILLVISTIFLSGLRLQADVGWSAQITVCSEKSGTPEVTRIDIDMDMDGRRITISNNKDYFNNIRNVKQTYTLESFKDVGILGGVYQTVYRDQNGLKTIYLDFSGGEVKDSNGNLFTSKNCKKKGIQFLNRFGTSNLMRNFN